MFITDSANNQAILDIAEPIPQHPSSLRSQDTAECRWAYFAPWLSPRMMHMPVQLMIIWSYSAMEQAGEQGQDTGLSHLVGATEVERPQHVFLMHLHEAAATGRLSTGELKERRCSQTASLQVNGGHA